MCDPHVTGAPTILGLCEDVPWCPGVFGKPCKALVLVSLHICTSMVLHCCRGGMGGKDGSVQGGPVDICFKRKHMHVCLSLACCAVSPTQAHAGCAHRTCGTCTHANVVGNQWCDFCDTRMACLLADFVVAALTARTQLVVGANTCCHKHDTDATNCMQKGGRQPNSSSPNLPVCHLVLTHNRTCSIACVAVTCKYAPGWLMSMAQD